MSDTEKSIMLSTEDVIELCRKVSMNLENYTFSNELFDKVKYEYGLRSYKMNGINIHIGTFNKLSVVSDNGYAYLELKHYDVVSFRVSYYYVLNFNDISELSEEKSYARDAIRNLMNNAKTIKSLREERKRENENAEMKMIFNRILEGL